MGENNDAALACKAFKRALIRRGHPRHLIFHSDRGSVYDSKDFKSLLIVNQVTPRMSRKADCWDKAVAESFFQSLKIEEVYQKNTA